MRISKDRDTDEFEIRLPASLQHLELCDSTVSFESWQGKNSNVAAEAHDTRLSRQVIVRQCKVSIEQSTVLLNRARQVAALKDASFVKIHAIEFDEEFVWIISEKLDGIDFKQWITSQHGDEKTAVRHLNQLIRAVNEVHQLGFAHGQLNAKSLFVDRSNRIRIDHFRFDVLGDGMSSDVSGQLDGLAEIAYVSPENFRDNQATPSADIYALGVIFYEMLMGRLPFAEHQGLALVAAQLQSTSEQWSWSSSFSPLARDLMLKMTLSQAQERFTASQTIEYIRDILTLDSTTGSLGSLSAQVLHEQVAQYTKRRILKKLGALLVIVVLSIATAILVATNWPQLHKFILPISESRELELGMQALGRFYRVDMLDQAESHFNRVLERAPQNAEAIAGLSIVYNFRYGGDTRDEVWHVKASAAAQQAMNIQPELAIVQMAYALALGRSQTERETANLAIQRAIDLAPKSLMPLQMQVRIMVWARQYDEGLVVIDRSLLLFPDDWFMFQMRGLILMNRAHFREAEENLQISLQKNPDAPNTYAFLSQALDSQDKTQQALEVLQQGLQVRPTASLYTMLGEMHMSSRDFEGAARAFQKACSPDSGSPQSYEAWMYYGESLSHLRGRESESREALEKSRDLINLRSKMMPKDGWNLAVKARIYGLLGEKSTALELANQSRALAPNNPAARAAVASAYVLVGNNAEALAEIELARKLGFPEKYIRSDSVFDHLFQAQAESKVDSKRNRKNKNNERHE